MGEQFDESIEGRERPWWDLARLQVLQLVTQLAFGIQTGQAMDLGPDDQGGRLGVAMGQTAPCDQVDGSWYASNPTSQAASPNMRRNRPGDLMALRTYARP